MLHIVYHDLYDLDVWDLVKVIPRMKAWSPSSDYEELMIYYGYEKKTSGAIDFTVSVNCRKESDGTLSFKNIITYEDGTVVEQEHLSEVNKRQVENGESFSTHIDMYNWCESGSHYVADPVTVYMSTTVAWREFDSEYPDYRKEYTMKVVPISIKQGIPSQGVIDSFEFFDGDHYVLWAYDGNVLRTWVSEGDDYIWEGSHGIEGGIGSPYCIWPGSALRNNMSLYGFFMGYFGEESTTTKISIGYNEAAPLYSRVISAEEFTTMPAESTF